MAELRFDLTEKSWGVVKPLFSVMPKGDILAAMQRNSWVFLCFAVAKAQAEVARQRNSKSSIRRMI